MSDLSPIIHTIEKAWSGFQTEWPDLPNATITVFRPEAQDRYGHFHAEQWYEKGEDYQVHEVMVSSVRLAQSGEAVLETLLHEAAHALNWHSGIKDCSNEGRYHNAKYKDQAEKVGLKVEKVDTWGWALTDLTDQTRKKWARNIKEIEKAITTYQLPLAPKGKGKGKTRLLKLTCPQCGRIIRASQKTIDGGPIVCQPCECEFE